MFLICYCADCTVSDLRELKYKCVGQMPCLSDSLFCPQYLVSAQQIYINKTEVSSSLAQVLILQGCCYHAYPLSQLFWKAMVG